MGESPRIESASKVEGQFAKGLSYGKPLPFAKSKALGFTSAGVLVVTITSIVFSGLPEAPVTETVQIETPTDVYQVQEVTLPTYSIADDYRQSTKTPAVSSIKKSVIVYAAPEKIERPRLWEIPPGTMVKAILQSGASNGPGVKAALSEAVEINGNVLLDEGTVLIGNGNSTEERLFIRFSQVVLKDGKVQQAQAQAADIEDKIIGLKGSKLGGYTSKLLAGTLLNFSAGLSEGLKQKKVENGVAIEDNSVKNAMLNGASSAALDLSRETFSEMRDQQPIIEVESGKEIYVIFLQN